MKQKTIEVYHESPNSIFKKVQGVTDGDYLLAHLYIENEEYKENYREALKQGRRVIVDNSIFEGKGLSLEQYLELLVDLNSLLKENNLPVTNLEYIIPDVLESYQETSKNLIQFMNLLDGLGLQKEDLGISIGVVQGKTYEEICNCYQTLYLHGIQKIAVSFDYSFYSSLVPKEFESDKLKTWCYGRPILLEKMLGDGVIKEMVPIHLLGCSLSREFGYFSSQRERFHFIQSLDTSNPVVSGLFNLNYPTPYGLDTKPSMKLCDMVDREVTQEEWEIVKDNIHKFKTLLETSSKQEFDVYKNEDTLFHQRKETENVEG